MEGIILKTARSHKYSKEQKVEEKCVTKTWIEWIHFQQAFSRQVVIIFRCISQTPRDLCFIYQKIKKKNTVKKRIHGSIKCATHKTNRPATLAQWRWRYTDDIIDYFRFMKLLNYHFSNNSPLRPTRHYRVSNL